VEAARFSLVIDLVENRIRGFPSSRSAEPLELKIVSWSELKPHIDVFEADGKGRIGLFVANNPVNLTDPFGLTLEDVGIENFIERSQAGAYRSRPQPAPSPYDLCMQRCLRDNYGWVYDVSSEFSYLSLAALAEEGLSNIIESRAERAVANAPLAGVNAGGSMANRMVAGNAAARQASRLGRLLPVLRGLGAITGIPSALATGIQAGAWEYCNCQCSR